MGTIFWFSHQPSEQSSNTSGNTIRAVLNLIPGMNQMPELQKEEVVEFLQPIARKVAHFSIYLLGGILIALFLNEFEYGEEKKIIISVIVGFIYAISDEIHQIFIPRKSLHGNRCNN